MGGPGGLPSMGSHRVGHNCSDLAAAAATFSLGLLSMSGGLFLFCMQVHLYLLFLRFYIEFSSVTQSCPTLCELVSPLFFNR